MATRITLSILYFIGRVKCKAKIFNLPMQKFRQQNILPVRRRIIKTMMAYTLIINVPRVRAKNGVFRLFFVGMATCDTESYSKCDDRPEYIAFHEE